MPLTAKDVAFTYNYIIDNELGIFIDYMKFIDKVEAPDDTHVRVHLLEAQGQHARALDPHPARAHLEQDLAPRTSRASSRTRRRSSAPAPSRRSSGRRASSCAWWPTRTTGAAPRRSTRSSSRPTRTRTRWRRTSRPAPSRAGWNIPLGAVRQPRTTSPTSRPSAAVTIGFDELGFNCADKKSYPKSTGHPVLQDPAFRQALNWAVDKEKIVSIGVQRLRRPGDTICHPRLLHGRGRLPLAPPADRPTPSTSTRPAGARRGRLHRHDGDGIREYKGKPIKLRLYARTESPTSQNCGKLIAGWFEDIGLKIDYQVIDDGALGDKQYNNEGDALRARLRHVHLGLGRRRRPELHPVGLTTDSDRQLERLQLVERGVRQALPRAADDDRPAGAHRDRPPHAADRLRRVAVHPARLPARPRGRQHAASGPAGCAPTSNGGVWWYNTQPDTYARRASRSRASRWPRELRRSATRADSSSASSSSSWSRSSLVIVAAACARRGRASRRRV